MKNESVLAEVNAEGSNHLLYFLFYFIPRFFSFSVTP